MKSKGVTISDSLPAVNSASCCLLGGGRKASSGVCSPGRLLPCLPRQPALQRIQLTAHRQARVGGAQIHGWFGQTELQSESAAERSEGLFIKGFNEAESVLSLHQRGFQLQRNAKRFITERAQKYLPHNPQHLLSTS